MKVVLRNSSLKFASSSYSNGRLSAARIGKNGSDVVAVLSDPDASRGIEWWKNLGGSSLTFRFVGKTQGWSSSYVAGVFTSEPVMDLVAKSDSGTMSSGTSYDFTMNVLPNEYVGLSRYSVIPQSGGWAEVYCEGEKIYEEK